MNRLESIINTGNGSVESGKRVFLVACLFALCFVLPAKAADFTIQPYLQAPGTTTMTIQWEMDSLAEGTVTFRKGTETAQVLTVSEPVKTPKGYTSPPCLYAATLTGLSPDTKYTYTVSSGGVSQSGSFSTFPEKADTFTFIAYGDSRSNPEGHKRVVANFRRHNPKFILHSGDFVGNGGDRPSWKSQFFKPLEGVLNHIPLFAAYGNHERRGIMLDFYFAPERLYYSFDYGNAHFNFLRSWKSEDEMAWQEKDMASSKATWRFAVHHIPSFNIGGKCGHWGQDTVVPLFRKHKVDVTITGDSHIYERFHPMVPLNDPKGHPITHIVSGGGGAPKYSTRDHPCVASHRSMCHFLVIKVKPESLTIDVRTVDDKLFETFTINKKDGVYDEAYLASVVPEEAVKMTLKLGGQVGFSSDAIPGPDNATKMTCAYTGGDPGFPIKGIVTLSEESKENYIMEPKELPFAVVSKEESVASFRMRSKSKVTVTGGGAISPPLVMTYHYKVGQVDLKLKGRVRLPAKKVALYCKEANPGYGWNKDGTLDSGRPWELGWVPVGTPAPQKRQWRYVSFAVDPKKLYGDAEEGDRLFTDKVPENLKGWYKPGFDDAAWQKGLAPIGKGKRKIGKSMVENPSAWGDGNILLMRTTFEVKDLDYDLIRLAALNKESYHLYLNGHRIRSYVWFFGRQNYRLKDMTTEVSKHLKKDTNVLAVYTMAAEKGVNAVDVFFDGQTKEGRARLDKVMERIFAPK